jgi:hypothetical protein
MRLSDQAVHEFKEICRDEFGVVLSDSDAEQRAWEVLDFFWILAVGSERARNTNFDRPTPEPLR